MKKTILSASFAVMLASALIMFTGTGCAHAYHGHSAHTSISMGFDNGYFLFSNFGHGHHPPKHWGHKPPHHGHGFHGHKPPTPVHHFKGHHYNGYHGQPRSGHGSHGHGGQTLIFSNYTVNNIKK